MIKKRFLSVVVILIFSFKSNAQEISLFVFDTKGNVLKQISYGLKQNLKNLEPEIK